MTNKKLIEKAKQKAERFQKLRKDPRYLKTIGKLKREGLLDVRDVTEYRGQVFLDDALWAAEMEPRIYELLPAIIVKRPKFFAFLKLPKDLEVVVKEIKKGRAKTPYQGIDPEKYNHWVPFVGKRSTLPKIMKVFRLSQDDLEILMRLSKEKSKSQTQIFSEALRAYAKKVSEI
jgi:hypothetical protein